MCTISDCRSIDLSNLSSIAALWLEPRLQIDSALRHSSALTLRESFSLAVSCFSSNFYSKRSSFSQEAAVLMTYVDFLDLSPVCEARKNKQPISFFFLKKKQAIRSVNAVLRNHGKSWIVHWCISNVQIQSLASGAYGMIEDMNFVLLCGAALEAWCALSEFHDLLTCYQIPVWRKSAHSFRLVTSEESEPY